MASRFWVGGTGTWDAADTTHWAASSNGAGGQSVPGIGDTVTIDASSGAGTITVAATANCASMTFGNAGLTLSPGSNTINCAGAWTWTAGTFTPGTSVIVCSGAAMTFAGGAQSYATVQLTGSGIATVTGINTFATLTRTATAAKTDTITLSANQTVTVALNINGNSVTNRLLVTSSTLGTTRTITTAGATVTSDNADYQDITLSVAKDLSAGSVGDCGGNTNITFTPAVAQTATGTASFTWSTHGWTTRVPLPQDDVSIPNAFVAGRTVTADMPRLGKSISFAGCTGSPIFANSVAQSIYGSLTLATGVTPSGTNRLTLSGRAICTITSALAVFTQGITINAPGGTYTLQDAFSSSRTGSATFTVTLGTFSDGGNTFALTDTTNTGFTMGGGVLNKTGIWSFSNTSASAFFTNTGGVVNDTGGAIILATASVNTRTFAGGGQTYFVLTYTVAGSTGQLTVTGDNTFDTINFSDPTNARILSLPTATSTTVRRFNVFGTSGKNMTVNGDVDSTSLQRIPDFLTIASSDATGGPWYAGANSTDGGSNTGWIFASAPPPDRPGLGSPISSMWNNRRVRSRLNRNERPNKTTITQPTHRQYHQAA